MGRTYSIIAPAPIGDELSLVEGGAVLVHTGTSTSLARVARGTVPRNTATPTPNPVVCIETAVFNEEGTSDADTPAGRWAFGVMTAAASVNAELGSGTTSMGWKPADGVVRYNGLNYLSALPLVTKEQYCSIEIDLTAQTFRLMVNDNPLRAPDPLPAGVIGVDIYPAASVCGPTDGSMKLHWQSGATGIESNLASGGWFLDSAVPDTLRVAAGGAWTSLPTDTPANECWRNAVVSTETLVTRRVWFWPWGEENPQSSYGDLTLDNSPRKELSDAGRYDSLTDEDVVGRVVELWLAPRHSSYGTRTSLATCIAVALEALQGDVVRVSLRGALSQLDKPLQHRILPPWTPEPWTPMPIAIGAARHVAGIPLDNTGEILLLHDSPLSNVAYVYNDADVFTPLTDWTLNNDARGITVLAAIANSERITADVSSIGTPIVVIPPVDPLGGVGDFLLDADTNSIADGWEDTGGIAGGFGTPFWSSGTQTLQSTSGSGAAAPIVIRTVSALVASDTAYRMTVVVSQANRLTNTTNQHKWFVGVDATQPDHYNAQFQGNTVGTFVRNIPAVPGARRIYMGAHGYMGVTFDQVILEELTSYTAPSLEGCTLTESVRDIMGRAKMPASDWSSADTDAIYAQLPAEFGVDFRRQQVTCLQALQKVLRPFASCAYEDTLGIIRFCRLFDPEECADVDLVLDLNVTDLASDPVPKLDRAPSLTTQVYARPNWSTFTDAQIAFSVEPSMRAALKAPGQLRTAVAAVLAGMYEKARNAEPFLSLFDSIEFARDELARILALYAVPRHFMVLDVIDCDPTINLGSVLRLTYERWGFTSGRKCFIHSIEPHLDGTGARIGVWY